MKRTSKFCAILFCAALWLNPVGAQQKTKEMPVQENNGTELKMDKVPFALERQNSLTQIGMEKVQAVKHDARFLNAREVLNNKLSETAELTEEQKLEGVRNYMRQAFASASKDGDATGLTHVFVGGSSQNNDMVKAVYVDGERTELSLCGFPYGSGGTRLHPQWGTWNGSFYEGMWAAGRSVVGYYTYDPLTGDANSLTSAYLSGDQGGILSDACAYDYSSNKVYSLVNGYTETYTEIDSITFYSANKGTAVFEEAFSIKISTSNIPVAMSINKTGKFYLFCTDGKIYTVNKGENDVYSLAEVGNTKQPTGTYSQSAAWDYRSDKMYLANINEGYGFMSVWDPANKDTSIQLGGLLQLKGLASVFYVAANPVAVANFGLVYKSSENSIEATFTVPSLDVNGDVITTLDTVEIFKVENDQLAGRVWAKQNPTPGEAITATLENPGTSGSTVVYAVRAKKQNGSYSAFTTASVLLFDVTLPYSNGFEDVDQILTNTTILAVDPQNQGYVGRVDSAHYEGSYSFRITGSYAGRDNRQMILQGIPVEKGAGYAVSFYGKTDVASDGILYAFDGADFQSYYSVANTWRSIELSYIAKATGQMSLTLQGYGLGYGSKFYIDNLKVVQTSSPAAPAAMAINNVTAAENGALQAIVNVTLPDKTMGGDNLAKIDSIVFEYVAPVGSSVDFTAAEKTTVKEGLTPGQTTNLAVAINKSGKYCLRALIYSGEERHPNYIRYTDEDGYLETTPWIGVDMLGTASILKNEAKPDGTVELVWKPVQGKNKAYVGEVTYILKNGETVLYTGKDTSCTTAALPMGAYFFSLGYKNSEDSTGRTVASLGGLNGDVMSFNMNTSAYALGTILNVSATADNSAFAQTIYPKSGKAMYIDTLLLFVKGSPTLDAKQYTKIYMGTTQQEAFQTGKSDLIEKENLTEVFADTLRFKAGEVMLRLPLKGFYYSGEENLVINFVKPLQEKTAYAVNTYMGGQDGASKRRTATDIDFDTVSSYNEYTSTNLVHYAPAMIAMPGQDLKTLTVKVDSMGTSALEGAIVTIVNKGGKNMNVRITTGADGSVSFAYMPKGTYNVKVEKAAYIASEKEVVIGETSPVEVTFSLIKAKELNIKGVVEDKGGNKLAGVAVKAAGLADFSATTTAEGAFELTGVYGPGNYTLSFEKAGLETYSMPFELGEKDTVLADAIEMAYQVVNVPMASVAVQEDGKALVQWIKPAVSTMMSWVSSFTQVRRLTIDNKSAFKYAQRFLPADLKALNLGSKPKAVRFGFVVGSEKANYSIVLAADTTHEIYRQQVPAEKLTQGEWCNIDIPATSIDTSRELWMIVEVAAGEDQDYPCATTTAGTIANKGNLMYYNKKWTTITNLFTSGAGNVLIRLLVEDSATQVEPANGYRVYRGLLEDDFEDYTLLTEQTVKTTTYTDAAYSTLPFGQYNYAVVSDWYGDDLSEPTYTNTLKKDMEFTVTFAVTSNAGSAKDAAIYMLDTAITRDYSAVVAENGQAVINKVWRDVYEYEITLPYHKTATGTLDLTQDTVIRVSLEEIILEPELTAAVEGKDVVVNYGVNLHNWSDDVESYEDFAISGLDPWILSPGVPKGGVEGCEWTNADEDQSWIVMNPSKTKPALSWAAHSGEKYFASMYRASQTETESDDWLVRPVSKGSGVFTFYCRAVSSKYPESFDVVYSTTTSDFSAFKVLPQGSVPSMTNTSWARGRFQIPADAKFVGIHCYSDDAFGLLVDDLSYQTEDPANPTGYELYLDGTKVATVKADALTYTFKDLSIGEHKVGVKAVFASGTSDLVEQTVNISNEAMPINLKAETSVGQAVLTWEMPAGFTPKNYKVFLNNELKAENLTEKTYTFSDLKNGKYTAAVVAVYETGESEKATVDFEIKGVDVEDFALAQVKVYPNPNNGLFYLQTVAAGVAEVYSMNGQLVKRVAVPAEGTYSIDLQNRAKGLYLLRFIGAEKTTLFKMVIR